MKVAVLGGPAAGKSVFVAALAQEVALTTEVPTQRPAVGVTPSWWSRPVTTTAAFDVARTVVGSTFAVYLFAASGEARHAVMRDYALAGAMGAVVLVDAGRLRECFAALDELESRRLPFVVLVNTGLGAVPYRIAELRDALALHDDVPVVVGEAADAALARECLIALMEHAFVHALTRPVASPNDGPNGRPNDGPVDGTGRGEGT